MSVGRTEALADLGGARPARAPPKGPNSFVLTYKIFKTKPPRESTPPPTRSTPPRGNPGSATEKSNYVLIFLNYDKNSSNTETKRDISVNALVGNENLARLVTCRINLYKISTYWVPPQKNTYGFHEDFHSIRHIVNLF